MKNKVYSVYEPTLFLRIKNLVKHKPNPVNAKEALEYVINKYKGRIEDCEFDLTSIKEKRANWHFLRSLYLPSGTDPAMQFTASQLVIKEEIEKQLKKLNKILSSLEMLQEQKQISTQQLQELNSWINKVTTPLSHGGIGLDFVQVDSGEFMNFGEVLQKEYAKLVSLKEETNNQFKFGNVIFSYR